MTAHSPSSGLHFLSVAEAAERLGVSRVKVREAASRNLIPSSRDNENRLRLDLTGLDPDILERKGKRLTQTALMNILFDEVEELHDALDERGSEVAALRAIADRQADALDRAADRFERDAADKARLSDMLDRALSHLEAGGDDADTARLADVSDRALSALEATGDQLENSLSQNARFDALIARALDYAEASKAAGAQDTKAMAVTAERAMQMLETALAEAETNRQGVTRASGMLDRALETGARLEQQIALRDREVEAKNATVEKALQMSERAVALAATQSPAPRKRTFWQWLTGK